MNNLSEIQKMLLSGEVSLDDLVDQHLKNIENNDENLNAMISVTADEARARALQLTELVKSDREKAFEQKPLLGMTTIFKDMYLTKGIKTTAGSKLLENYIPQYSSTVVDRVLNAGAILLGKANQDAWAHGSSGENSDFGTSKNPWDNNLVPGGSSSGSAVAVAADYSLVSFGTDTGGSIRLPASFCGVVGFKPTYGSVSRYGVVAMASSLDTIGHFARTVEDVEKVFNITKGPDGKDSTVISNIEPTANEGSYKIGLPKEYFAEGLSKEVQKIVEKAIDVYKKLGVEFVEISLPHTKYVLGCYYIIMPAEVSSNLGRYDGVRYGNVRQLFGEEAKRRIMLGTYSLSAGYYDAYYLKASKVRSKLIDDFDQAFESVDAILAPVSPTPPFKLGEKSSDPLQMYLADIYTCAANLAGIPGLSIPAGFTENNLPIGFQLLGPRFSEDRLFDLGKQFQSETEYHLKRPNLL